MIGFRSTSLAQRGAGLALLLVAAMGAPATEPPGRAEPPPVGVATLPDGAKVVFEVIDGLQVVGGDMVIGQAAAGATSDFGRLWPEGIIPYEIDADERLEQKVVEEAISDWNDKTVIEMVPRTDEPDYVRFLYGRPRSAIGKVGGEQMIWVGIPRTEKNTVVHEIGHAVGLLHEHQRRDRDRYLTALNRDVEFHRLRSLATRARPFGPYDYASTMHYGRGYIPDRSDMETIPPGLPLPFPHAASGLSVGDVDTVARLYGKVPAQTTITSHPEGIEVIVDGVPVTTPAAFDWAPGSLHTVEAPVHVHDGRRRLLFGGWTDGGVRAHIFEAATDSTWLGANYIAQYPVTVHTRPRVAVDISPGSADGYVTLGTRLRLAVAEDTHRLTRWSDMRHRAGRASYVPIESPAANPAHRVLGVGLEPGHPIYQARLTDLPLLSIVSAAYSVPFAKTTELGQLGYNTPAHFVPFEGERAIEGYRVVNPWDVDHCYRFLRWSDDGPRERRVEFPEGGGELRLHVETHFPLQTRVQGGDARIEMDPAPLPRSRTCSRYPYFTEGQLVRLTAPAHDAGGARFVGWAGDAWGTSQSIALRMDGVKRVDALYSSATNLDDRGTQAAAEAGSRQIGNYVAYVPLGATELVVEAAFPDGDALALLASQGGTFSETAADHRLPLTNGRARLNITATSRIPLVAGVYHVAVVAEAPLPSGTIRTGTLRAEVHRGAPVVRPTPRAFTFVAPVDHAAPAQRLRLENLSAQSESWRIEPNRRWITVSPAEGTIGPGQSAEVEVRVGLGIVTGTHHGTLSVRRGSSGRSGMPLSVTYVNLNAGSPAFAFSIDDSPDGLQRYGNGARLTITATFDDAMEVQGSPRLALEIGDGVRLATLARVERRSLVFDYLVRPGDLDEDGVGVFGFHLSDDDMISYADGTLADLHPGDAQRARTYGPPLNGAGAVYTFAVSAEEDLRIEFADLFGDLEPSTQTFAVSSSDPDVLAVRGLDGGLTVTAINPGTATVTIVAAGDGGRHLTRSFSVEVRPAEARSTWRGWRLELLRKAAEKARDEP